MIHVKDRSAFPIALLVLVALAGCQSEQNAPEHSSPAAAGSGQTPAPLPTSPGKLSAPITIDYEIMGNPVVGQPVGVNVQVSSSLNDRPITLNYRFSEAGSMTFPESQVESAALLPIADNGIRSQQVTLVPQREGRLYLVVSAEIETDNGAMIKSISIPIQVGRAPFTPTTNGELVEGTDGEIGVSMPAREQ